MKLPAPSFLTDTEIERRALAILREHEKRTGKPIQLPVPIESIVERTLGLRIVWLEIEEPAGEVILARIDPQYEGHPTVQINERRLHHFETYFGTEPYSLAHESGHWVLHLDRGRSTQLPLNGLHLEEHDRIVLCRRLNDHDRRELQAERFAAYLLLPEHLLRSLTRNLDLTRWSVIASLARECGVSKTAMRRRLEQLGVILVGPNGQLVMSSKLQEARLLF